MRRLARLLFTLCSAASLLLCVAVCVLWVRSYGWFDDLGWVDDRLDDVAYTHRLVRVGSARGTLLFTWRESASPWLKRGSGAVGGRVATRVEPGWYWKSEAGGRLPVRGSDPPVWEFGAFGWGGVHQDRPPAPYAPMSGAGRTRPGRFVPAMGRPGLHGYVVRLPHALPCVLLALPPAILILRWRRARRRHKQDLCPACGYDLRASPERCPECGAAKIGQDSTFPTSRT